MGRCKGSYWKGNTRIPNPSLKEHFIVQKEIELMSDLEAKESIKHLENKKKKQELSSEEKRIIILLKNKLRIQGEIEIGNNNVR